MRPYFIFVTGGMSGLGKGIVAASVGKILLDIGYRVSVVKIDPYLNIDAGTMSPYEHGEVFVTKDGYESDQDLGLYERFLNKDMTKDNNITSGKVYKNVLENERQGRYLGKTVQMIPNVTKEIKDEIFLVTEKDKPHFCIVEIGGTVGDIESSVFLEAAKEISLKNPSCFMHVTFVPTLTLNEQKTKLSQHSIRELRENGIEPDFIFARSKEKLSNEARKKISIFSNIPESNIISAYDVDDICTIPINFAQQNLDVLIAKKFNLRKKKARLSLWKNAIERKKRAKNNIKIAIIGKYSRLKDAYVSIEQAFKHCEYSIPVNIELDWIEAEDIRNCKLKEYSGILVPGGFGNRGVEEKIAAIKCARENNIPYLGLCLGFQLACVEFARNVLRLKDSNSTEFNERTRNPIIHILPYQNLNKMGGTMRLGEKPCIIKIGTLAEKIYKNKLSRNNEIEERHRHRYEFNNSYTDKFQDAGAIFSGVSKESLMEIFELKAENHGFFIATQFHPEFKSRLENPAPLFLAFSKACLDYKRKKLT